MGNRVETSSPYPATTNATLRDKIALGEEITIHCHGCRHNAPVDLVALGFRVGFDRRFLAPEFKRVFYCASCRAAGRPDRNTGVIVGSSKWAQAGRDRDEPLPDLPPYGWVPGGR